jgi:hypothetical protein
MGRHGTAVLNRKHNRTAIDHQRTRVVLAVWIESPAKIVKHAEGYEQTFDD